MIGRPLPHYRKFSTYFRETHTFKILAGLIACVYLVALIILGMMVLNLPVGTAQRLMFFYWVVTSISGITIVLTVYAFAVLLLVAMDIEYNTREE